MNGRLAVKKVQNYINRYEICEKKLLKNIFKKGLNSFK